MNYFIGIPIPHNYKLKMEKLRAEFRFFYTEPHIKLISHSHLPNCDCFVKKVIEVCSKTERFSVKLDGPVSFSHKKFYLNVISEEIPVLYQNLCQNLNIAQETEFQMPRLTVVQQRSQRTKDASLVISKCENDLSPYPQYTVNSIIIYKQPKENSVYIPYMSIPLSDK